LETIDMTFTKKLTLMLSLTAAMTFSAQAQDAKVKFTLPHAAQIGEAVLPAGQYTFALSMNGITTATITPADRKGAAIFALPVSTDVYANCAGSSVSMKRDGVDWSVRSVCFAEPQVALYFAQPADKETVASIAPTPAAVAGR
jgi:hypothetical protein